MKKAKVLQEIIEGRKSNYPKDFSEEKISKKELRKILESAEFAPNHKKTRPWRFQVFREERKADLALEFMNAYRSSAPNSTIEKKLASIQEKFDQTNTIITISVNYSGKIPNWEELAATAMAVQNMYLTCTVLEVGCYWSSPAVAENIESFLELESNERCIGLFYMGKLKKN